jgi:cell division protein ZapA
MGQVSLTVNGRQYDVGCDDGQEPRLHQLADYLNRRAAELVGGAGQIGEARLLLMVSLLIADELMDAKAELQGERHGHDGEHPDRDSLDEAVGLHLESLAGRLEDIAERLKPS